MGISGPTSRNLPVISTSQQVFTTLMASLVNHPYPVSSHSGRPSIDVDWNRPHRLDSMDSSRRSISVDCCGHSFTIPRLVRVVKWNNKTDWAMSRCVQGISLWLLSFGLDFYLPKTHGAKEPTEIP
jgi:hypothetical protein